MEGLLARCSAALLLLAALAALQVARADDYGPHRDIRAIRHDLPILAAAEAKKQTPSETAAVDAVVIDGDRALAQWHTHSIQRIYWLKRQYDRWWVEHEIWIDPKDGSASCCGGYGSPWALDGPTPFFLAYWLKIPQPLANLAAIHLPLVTSALRREAAVCTSGFCRRYFHADGYVIDGLWFSRDVQLLGPNEYGMTVAFAANDAPPSAGIKELIEREPTEAESWVTFGGNSYFFFSGTVQASQAVHVQPGTTIDVWFPFVLDPSLRYSLTIAAPNVMSIGPVEGTLADNTLHFTLPAFTAPPGADLMGEIESD